MSDIRRVRPQIIVATPGRLIDLLENYGLDISSSQFQILDEGDKMLDMDDSKSNIMPLRHEEFKYVITGYEADK